jgi:hypothetical protein
MLDAKKIQDAMATGLSFICAMCKHWHAGVDAGLMDAEGNPVCMHSKVCFSPLSGGSFEYYDGPMEFNAFRFCYICGKVADKAIEPQVPNAKRVGVCSRCFEEVVKKSARRALGRRIIFTTAERAGPDKFSEV